MSGKKVKIKFLKNYTPREKGEVVELEEKVAEFYLNNGVAEFAGELDETGGCEGCNKAEKLAEEVTVLQELLKGKDSEIKEGSDKLEETKTALTEKDNKINELSSLNNDLTEELKSLKAELKKTKTALTKARNS